MGADEPVECHTPVAAELLGSVKPADEGGRRTTTGATGCRAVDHHIFDRFAGTSIMQHRPTRRSLLAGLASLSLAGCQRPVGGGASLAVAETAPIDRETPIRVSGLADGDRVTIAATASDAEDDEWHSTQTYEATGGTIDTGEQAPIEATFDGVAPMGWVWSMASETASAIGLPDSGAWTIDLTVETAGETLTRSIDRQIGGPEVAGRDLDGVVGRLYHPTEGGPHPGVIVLHGSEGTAEHVRARLLAAHGYAALAIQYFGSEFGPGDPIPTTLSDVPLSYFDDAARAMRATEAVREGPIGVDGVSRGGELAAILGAQYDWVGAVVSVVGSAVRWASVQRGRSWQYEDGDPAVLTVDFRDYERTDGGALRGRPAFERALDAASEADLEAATIPVERIDAPVAFVSAGDDQLWPSTRLSAIGERRLDDRAVAFEHDHRAIERAGHAIFPPYTPTVGRSVVGTYLYGGSPAGYATADHEHWSATLSTLAAGLGGD